MHLQVFNRSLKSVENVLELDKQDDNEMNNFQVVFNAIEDGSQPPNGFQHVKCHMIFDMTLEDICNCRQIND